MRYIVGTPTNTEQRRVSISSSTTTGLKLGIDRTLMPATAAEITDTNPMMCATGNANSASIGPPESGSSISTGRSENDPIWPTKPRWLSAAPLGLPVVPDV